MGFCCFDSRNYRLLSVFQEGRLIDDVVVEGVPQIVATSTTAMPVIDGEERTLGVALGDIEDDADSVFVVVARYSLVGVSSIRSNTAHRFHGCFRGFVVDEFGVGGNQQRKYLSLLTLVLRELVVGCANQELPA